MRITGETELRFASDTARGMRYLHSQEQIHRDLKPANLLISERWVVKVADFGTSRLLERNMEGPRQHVQGDPEKQPLLLNEVPQTVQSLTDSRDGSLLWQAPELEKGNQNYGKAVDVYRWVVEFNFQLLGEINPSTL